jgi:3-oxo-5alpha-steroid 4-dehydrogenase
LEGKGINMTVEHEILSADSVSAWSVDVDVLIVGGGMAGMCAAIEARAHGATVLLIERAGGTGGSSALAGGHFYLGGGTPVQLATGFADSVEEMYKFIVAVSTQPNLPIIRAYCDGSVEHFHWLEAQGVPFERSYYPHKHVIQPTRECLIWSGNEKVWPFRGKAVPAPRGHKVAVEGEEGGAVAMKALTAKAEEAGVRFQCSTTAVALFTDADGAIVGVRARQFGEQQDIRARTTMLATGGFNLNPEMVARYVPALKQVDLLGSPNDLGAGILLGIAAGGQAINMDGALITSPFYPPVNLLKGVIVNALGKRFVAEDSYHGRTGAFTLEQPDRKAYLIADSSIFGYPEYEFQALIDGWDTVAEMEEGLELPKGSLQETLAQYNAHAANGEDPEFGKYPEWIAPLTSPPYAAFDLTFGKATYFAGLTLGGLHVTPDGEVLRPDNTVIKGLYAGGGTASLIAQDGHGYASGTCLGQASFFGRRAGRHAAQAARKLAVA